MELVLAILSWVVTILLPLLILSLPLELLLGKLKKNWKSSKTKKVYQTVQLSGLGVWVLSLMIVVVLMFL